MPARSLVPLKRVPGHLNQPWFLVPEPLRDYQWTGATFLAERASALLADEMGLGKTIQAIIAMRYVLDLPGCDRALIVAPASLLLNWQRELEKWAPDLAVRRLQGSVADHLAAYYLPVPVVLASFDQIRMDVVVLSTDTNIHFDVVVLDEAQRIKNPASGVALACGLIPRSRSWALTGTPVENSVRDLTSILGFVKPAIAPRNSTRAVLHRAMRPYFLRRRKFDVLPELPPIIVQDLQLELSGAQRHAYDALWNARFDVARSAGVPASRPHLLALITRLKQLCNMDLDSNESSKYESLRLIVDGLTEPDHKLIVFSQYVETLTWLQRKLDDIPCEIFHGGISLDEREAVIARFESHPGPRVLLISLRAGGVGLNLKSASNVVLFDRWWNPATEDQAIQRAHRFGRERPLHVVRFLVVDSIEERISHVLARKYRLFERYIEGAENALVGRLSRDELRGMLALDAASVDG